MARRRLKDWVASISLLLAKKVLNMLFKPSCGVHVHNQLRMCTCTGRQWHPSAASKGAHPRVRQ